MIKFVKRHLLIFAIFLTFIVTALLYTIQLLLNGGDPVAVLQRNAELANHWLAWRVVLYSGVAAFYVYLVRRHNAQGNAEHVAYLKKSSELRSPDCAGKRNFKLYRLFRGISHGNDDIQLF